MASGAAFLKKMNLLSMAAGRLLSYSVWEVSLSKAALSILGYKKVTAFTWLPAGAKDIMEEQVISQTIIK